MEDCGGYGDFELIAEVYDAEYAARRDIDFYVGAAGRFGDPVLEVGCGTGRVLIPTARAEHRIVGMDLSDQMLEICRKKVAQESQEVRHRIDLVRADMREFELGREFSLVTIPFRPFQHLTTPEDQVSCLKSIRRHLKPGGRLVFDLFNPWMPFLTDETKFDEWGDDPDVKLDDGRIVRRRFRIARRDYFRQVQDCEIIYYTTYPDGRTDRQVHSFPMRYLFRWEAEHLLVRCGFEIEALYAGFDRAPFGSRDPGELIFVARRAG